MVNRSRHSRNAKKRLLTNLSSLVGQSVRNRKPSAELSTMRTKSYFIDSLINKDVVDNKTTETVTLKDCATTQSQLSLPSSVSMTDNYSREENRIKSFVNWPHTFIDPKKLALTGFYYIGHGDNVKCNFCKAEIGRWEPEDDEVTEHIRWSPNCPLLKRRETNNVPINEAELERILPPATYDICGPFSINNVRSGSYAESSFSVPPATEWHTYRNPDHVEYAIESARLRSYEDWPKTMKQTPKDLSDAGFFYTGTGDRVKCFSCGGGLRDWDENDVPWEQHALWFSKCEYLKLIKGQEYINAVIASKKQQTETVLVADRDTVKTVNFENGSTSTSSTSNLNNRTNSNSSNSSSTSNSSNSTSTSTSSSSSNTNNICNTSCIAKVSPATGNPSTASELVKEEQMNEKKICDSKLCKICYSCEYNTAFFPCGHVVACAKCASSVTKCPMCRKTFEHVIRVYFS